MQETIQKYPKTSLSVSGVAGAILAFVLQATVPYINEVIPSPDKVFSNFDDVKVLVTENKETIEDSTKNLRVSYLNDKIAEADAAIKANNNVSANKIMKGYYETELGKITNGKN